MHTRRTLAVYTLSHFCVDFGCFFLLTGAMKAALTDVRVLTAGYLLYNVIAFGLQAPIGFFCDGRSPRLPAAAGCILMLLGLALPADVWLRMGLCALGNAFFHVGGGIDALLHAGGRLSRSGVYVSSGALGVTLGTLAGGGDRFPLWLTVALMGAAFFAVLMWGDSPRPRRADLREDRFHRPALERLIKGSLPVVLMCLLSVVIRAYGGGALRFSWNTGFLALLPGTFSCLGKAAGGYLADRFGPRKVGTASLLLSLPLLCFGMNSPWLCLPGILLFNMTMPITLYAVALRMPGKPGFAFGLTTLALLAGTVPLYLLRLDAGAIPLVLAVCTLLSAASVLLAVPKPKRSVDRDTTDVSAV